MSDDRTIPPLLARVDREVIDKVARWCDEMSRAERVPGQSVARHLVAMTTFRTMTMILRDLTVIGVTRVRRNDGDAHRRPSATDTPR